LNAGDGAEHDHAQRDHSWADIRSAMVLSLGRLQVACCKQLPVVGYISDPKLPQDPLHIFRPETDSIRIIVAEMTTHLRGCSGDCRQDMGVNAASVGL